MSITGLLIGLVILAAALAWIAVPLLRQGKTRQEDAQAAKQRERLLIVYERVLTNIRDLEEDHQTGKMNADDFEAERETWVQRGIQVLKALDRLDAEGASVEVDDATFDRTIDDEIEAAVAKYRVKS
jgi:hypothetical protein